MWNGPLSFIFLIMETAMKHIPKWFQAGLGQTIAVLACGEFSVLNIVPFSERFLDQHHAQEFTKEKKHNPWHDWSPKQSVLNFFVYDPI